MPVREAERARTLLRAAAAAWPDGAGEPAARVTVRPFVVVVGGRLTVRAYACGVTVVMTDRLLHALGALPSRLGADEVEAVFGVARRSTTWNPPTGRLR